MALDQAWRYSATIACVGLRFASIRPTALYSRLTERDKPHAVALVACARKLLIFANTVVARGTPRTEKNAEA